MNTANTKKIVHLRNYTQYSLSKGAIKINELVQYCVENKIPAVAISDFNNLFGCMEFSIECKKKGIQPIIGCQLNLDYSDYSDSNKREKSYVSLIAKSAAGYKNLMKLSSLSFLRAGDDVPHITFEFLKKYSDDLILLSGGPDGPIGQLLRKRKNLKALVTAGPTREYLDPVRYISNESSGKQGYEIAHALNRLGIKTTLITGPSNLVSKKEIKT